VRNFTELNENLQFYLENGEGKIKDFLDFLRKNLTVLKSDKKNY
jgi:hypothetical protein